MIGRIVNKLRPTNKSAPKARSPVRTFPSSGYVSLPVSNKIEEETLEWYSPKVFYPVYLGQIFERRYQVISKAGYGSSSTVWLARDLEFVAHLHRSNSASNANAAMLTETISTWLSKSALVITPAFRGKVHPFSVFERLRTLLLGSKNPSPSSQFVAKMVSSTSVSSSNRSVSVFYSSTECSLTMVNGIYRHFVKRRKESWRH